MDNTQDKDLNGQENSIIEETTGVIQPVEIDKEMRTAYIDYSMSFQSGSVLPPGCS